jgi:hypothetical protein
MHPGSRGAEAPEPSATSEDRESAVPQERWSVLGPHGTGNHWSLVGMSGHGRQVRIAGHRPYTATTSDGEAALDRVRTPQPSLARLHLQTWVCAGRILPGFLPAEAGVRARVRLLDHVKRPGLGSRPRCRRYRVHPGRPAHPCRDVRAPPRAGVSLPRRLRGLPTRQVVVTDGPRPAVELTNVQLWLQLRACVKSLAVCWFHSEEHTSDSGPPDADVIQDQGDHQSGEADHQVLD